MILQLIIFSLTNKAKTEKTALGSWCEMEEAFLKSNCGPDIVIQGNEANYAKGAWNIAYGDVVIDPESYPNAVYKWILEPINRNLDAGNMAIGIASNFDIKSKDIFYGEGSASYGYQYGGSLRICGKIHSENKIKYNTGHEIIMIIETDKKSISWYNNGKFRGSAQIDTSRKYKLAVQLSLATIKLHEFGFIQDIEVLIAGFVHSSYDNTKGYDDIIKLISKYYTFRLL